MRESMYYFPSPLFQNISKSRERIIINILLIEIPVRFPCYPSNLNPSLFLNCRLLKRKNYILPVADDIIGAVCCV